jgi:hypothetical protein
VDDIKIRELRCAGYIIRKEDERIPETVLNGKFHNKIPVEKPKTRWEDVDLRNSSQILGIRRWRRRQKTEKNGGVF